MSKPKLEHSHQPDDIAARLNENNQHSYLRDFVYGATDGIVTTFAIVSGVAGANLGSAVIILLGAANLIADGFSMAASNFLGTKTEEQMRDNARSMEISHIRLDPEGEKEEIRQIFAAKGFEGNDLEQAVDIITSNQEQWLSTMMAEEHGFGTDNPSPSKAAWVTFFAFVVAGVIPLLPFFIGDTSNESQIRFLFLLSTIMTGVAFFLVGASKSFFIQQSWWRAGLETFLVGGIAAAIAYLVGFLLYALLGIKI